MTTLKKNLSVVSKYQAFFTGGQIQVSKNGQYLFCQCDWKIQVIHINTGKVEKSLGQEEEPISYFLLSPDDKYVVAATRMMVLRQWDWESGLLVRSWRAIHTAPVSCMTFDPTSTLLATGSSDSTIKVWDIIEQYCTHNFKGHQGVVSVAEFRPSHSPLQLVSGADDYKVRVWDLTRSECVAVVDAHFSLVTSLTFSPDGKHLYSGGRDSVVAVWDMEKLAVRRTIPVFEPVESVMLMPEVGDYSDLDLDSVDCPHVMVAGSKGTVRVVNTLTSRCVHTRSLVAPPCGQEEEAEEQVLVQAFQAPALSSVVVVTYDNNIVFHNDHSLTLTNQLSGSANEVLDVQFIGEKDSHIVVVSNSEKLKVFSVDTWSCHIVEGHTDIVLAVDVYPKLDLLVSSSKDCSVRLWKFLQDTGSLVCVARALGHVQPVGAVAFSSKSPSFIVSGGRDNTVKLWPLPSTLDTEEVIELKCQATEPAHDKDINSLVVSPNDKFIATASQDKTAKLWKASKLSLIGVFRGHSRGVWCVQFSPVDQCLATSSTDGSVRIWSLADFSCVKTFEGHDASVLKVVFVSRGMQLLSVGSDGLLKLWTIKTNDCVKTFDEHEAKVWSVACSQDEERVVTADADSTIILWKDVSEQEEEETLLQQEQFILQQQELSNLIQEKRYLKAIRLTITLEQPYRLLTLLKEILFEEDGKKKLEETLSKLRPDQIDAVLRFSQSWNTNSKHCHVTQLILGIVLRSCPTDDIRTLPSIRSTVEGILPYTERHFQRLSRLYQQARFVEYTWQCMKMVSRSEPQPLEQEVPEQEDVASKSQNSSNSVSESDEETSQSQSSSSESDSEDLSLNLPDVKMSQGTKQKPKVTESLNSKVKNTNTPKVKGDQSRVSKSPAAPPKGTGIDQSRVSKSAAATPRGTPNDQSRVSKSASVIPRGTPIDQSEDDISGAATPRGNPTLKTKKGKKKQQRKSVSGVETMDTSAGDASQGRVPSDKENNGPTTDGPGQTGAKNMKGGKRKLAQEAESKSQNVNTPKKSKNKPQTPKIKATPSTPVSKKSPGKNRRKSRQNQPG